ncbi:MAG: YceD family protein, partial [Flavobacteriaceae bacterium]
MKEFVIPFVGLKEGKHHFEFEITKTFFDNFGYDEFNDVAIKTTMLLNKKSTMMELEFDAQGTINVNCDLTNEPFDQPIKADLKLIVKFGEEFNDENEEILILPHGEYEVNVQQYIYEM